MKINKMLLLFLTVFFMTSCGMVDENKQASNEKSEEIIRCFDENDIEGLKQLFCQNSQANYNLDEEIKAAFDLYEGTSESYNLHYGGSAGSWRNGECKDEHITPQIRNLKTDSENIYLICYHEYLIYKEEQCVGITYIRIFDESTGEMVQIGEHVY